MTTGITARFLSIKLNHFMIMVFTLLVTHLARAETQDEILGVFPSDEIQIFKNESGFGVYHKGQLKGAQYLFKNSADMKNKYMAFLKIIDKAQRDGNKPLKIWRQQEGDYLWLEEQASNTETFDAKLPAVINKSHVDKYKRKLKNAALNTATNAIVTVAVPLTIYYVKHTYNKAKEQRKALELSEKIETGDRYRYSHEPLGEGDLNSKLDTTEESEEIKH